MMKVRNTMSSMYERIKSMGEEEMRKFVYWVYTNGRIDGQNGCFDSPDGFFGGRFLTLSAKDLMPNNSVYDLYATLDKNLPSTYAEVEYDDFDNPEAVDGARFDDMNYLRYTER